MPQDRFLHSRMARSRKVAALDDLDFRVWIATILHADDRGILPRPPAYLRGQDDALSRRSEAEIDASITRCVTSGLLLEYEHQEARWLCHPMWADYQKFTYFRDSYYPPPPSQMFQKLSRKTSEIFRKSFKKIFRSTPTVVSPSPSSLLTTNPPTPLSQKPPDPFERFWRAYPKRVGKGAARKAWLTKKPEVEKVLAAVEVAKTTDQWRKDAGRFIPNPATWLNQERWLDELPMTQNGQNGHVPEPRALRPDGFPMEPRTESRWFNRGDCDPNWGFARPCIKNEFWDAYVAEWGHEADRGRDQCPKHRGGA